MAIYLVVHAIQPTIGRPDIFRHLHETSTVLPASLARAISVTMPDTVDTGIAIASITTPRRRVVAGANTTQGEAYPRQNRDLSFNTNPKNRCVSEDYWRVNSCQYGPRLLLCHVSFTWMQVSFPCAGGAILSVLCLNTYFADISISAKQMPGMVLRWRVYLCLT